MAKKTREDYQRANETLAQNELKRASHGSGLGSIFSAHDRWAALEVERLRRGDPNWVPRSMKAIPWWVRLLGIVAVGGFLVYLLLLILSRLPLDV